MGLFHKSLLLDCPTLDMCCFLYPATINLTKPPVYHYATFFEDVVSYMPLGILCTRLIIVISFANPAQPVFQLCILNYSSLIVQCHNVYNIRSSHASMI